MTRLLCKNFWIMILQNQDRFSVFCTNIGVICAPLLETSLKTDHQNRPQHH